MGRLMGSKNGIQPDGTAYSKRAPEERDSFGADQFNSRNKISEWAEALNRLTGGK